jgi:hypothetical protein
MDSDALKGQGIQGTVLNGANYSPDLWYPYLWMLGGDIVVQKDRHPTKGTYWFQHIIALQVLKHWNSSKNKLMQVLNQ